MLRDVDGRFKLPSSPPLNVVATFHVKVAVAIYASLAMFIFFQYSAGTPLESVTLGICQVFA